MSPRPSLPSLAAVVATVATASVFAQGTPRPAAPASTTQAPVVVAPLTAPLPVDPQITLGRLPNGIRYYVRANKRPENRAELRLVVNAGSLLEDDDQRGLAHFVEHMAFNGTKHFPKQDVTSFMEGIGMRFGRDVNAYTSFDETVFMLDVPTEKREVMDKAMLVLEDWAQGVSFDPVEIDKERGVVLEEWRLGRGADARMQDAYFPTLLKGSRYADRLPIGKPEILQNFKAERLVQFYKDWYRPDLMAVVAVGDFDKAAVETMIKSHFTAIPAAKSPRPRPAFDVPAQAGTLYAIASDKEATSTTVSVYVKSPTRDPQTGTAYRQQIVEGLFSGMLSSRLGEIAQKPDAPFMAAAAGNGSFVRTTEATMLNALVKDGGAPAGLQALYTEAERVARFGFTAAELDRRKQNLLRSLERAVAEKDRQNSPDLASEFVRNFLTNEPIPGIVYENELTKQVLPTITLAEVNALAKNWSPDRNRVVVVTAPAKDGLASPTSDALGAAIRAGSDPNATLQPYTENLDAQPLVDPLPAPGVVVKSSTKTALGVTEWELANGVKVVLKPTTYKEDEVVFRAFSPGGTSLASDADYVSASTASQIVALSGFGKFNATDLRKVLTGKVASVRPTIGETDEGLSGGGSRKDLETLFQLIYLTFTAPRADPTLFGVITSQTKAMLANQKATPEFAFDEALTGALSQNHFRARPMTPEMIDEMNLEKAMAFYRDRFADASDFTFVFAGSFDPAALKPLVEQYIGSLPSTRRKESWRDEKPKTPAAVVEKRVNRGIEPKSQTEIVFSGDFPYDPPHRATMRAMGMILETRLREILREDLGGTYSVSASPTYEKYPRAEYTVDISFGSAPDRAEALVKRVFDEIEAFKKSGPTQKQLDDARETLRRDFETNSKQNNWLVSQIAGRYENGEDLESLFNLPEMYAGITAADVQAAARTYLNVSRYVKVMLFPEK